MPPSLVHSFFRRVMFSLAVIAACLSAPMVSSQLFVGWQNEAPALLGAIARQRALIADISEGAEKIPQAQSQGERIRNTVALEDMIAEMDSNNQALSGRTLFSREAMFILRDLFPRDQKPDTTELIDEYLAAARGLINDTQADDGQSLIALRGSMHDELTGRFDAAIHEFQQMVGQRLEKNRRWEAAIWSLSLATVVFLFLFVFQPFGRRLQQELTETKEKQDKTLQAMQTVGERESRYDLAFRAAIVGIWDWDLKTNKLWWAPMLKEMLGIRHDFFSDDFSELENRLHREDAPQVLQAIREHIETGVRLDTQARIRHADGSYIWFHMRGQAVWDERGKPVRLTGTMDDITLQKEMEMSSQMFREGIEASEIAIAIVDMASETQRFTYASRGLCAMTGYDPSRFLAGNLNVLHGPETPMEDLKKIDQSMRRGEKMTITTVSYRKDGSAFMNRIRLIPVFNAKNTLAAYVTIHEDLGTDLRKQDADSNNDFFDLADVAEALDASVMDVIKLSS